MIPETVRLPPEQYQPCVSDCKHHMHRHHVPLQSVTYLRIQSFSHPRYAFIRNFESFAQLALQTIIDWNEHTRIESTPGELEEDNEL